MKNFVRLRMPLRFGVSFVTALSIGACGISDEATSISTNQQALTNSGCEIYNSACPNHTAYAGYWFNDTYNNAANDNNACSQRIRDYRSWCGGAPGTAYTLGHFNGASLPAVRHILNDYDGDGKTDPTVWRPSTGEFFPLQSSSGGTYLGPFGSPQAPYFDTVVPGDYDGDGKADRAVWRSSTGVWYIVNSSTGQGVSSQYGAGYAPFFDKPVQGDYDGDGRTDVAVWRTQTGEWFYISSATGQPVYVGAFGTAGAPYDDVPVPGDYDGDGRTDIAVWRRQTGEWFIRSTQTGAVTVRQWGGSGDPWFDVPVQNDYDGDGKTDIAVWRRNTGEWFIIRSGNGQTDYRGPWGTASAPYNDVPVLGDFDGDGKADIALYRPAFPSLRAQATWYSQSSALGSSPPGILWGAPNDIPLSPSTLFDDRLAIQNVPANGSQPSITLKDVRPPGLIGDATSLSFGVATQIDDPTSYLASLPPSTLFKLWWQLASTNDGKALVKSLDFFPTAVNPLVQRNSGFTQYTVATGFDGPICQKFRDAFPGSNPATVTVRSWLTLNIAESPTLFPADSNRSIVSPSLINVPSSAPLAVLDCSTASLPLPPSGCPRGQVPLSGGTCITPSSSLAVTISRKLTSCDSATSTTFVAANPCSGKRWTRDFQGPNLGQFGLCLKDSNETSVQTISGPAPCGMVSGGAILDAWTVSLDGNSTCLCQQ
jgi:hypothetical protein